MSFVQSAVGVGTRTYTRDTGVAGGASMAFQDAAGVAITGGTLDGVTIGGSVEAIGYFTTLAASGTATFGDGAANYVQVAGGASGQPITFTAVGADASPDVRFVLPGRGLVNLPRLAIGNNQLGSALAAPRLATLYADQTLSGSGGQAIRIGGIMRGTVTGNLEGYYSQIIDEDRVAFSDINQGMLVNYVASTMRQGWSGGRTLHQTQLYVGNPANPGTSSSGTSGVGAYQVSGASFAYSYGPAGGRIGDHRGSLFGRNDATRVRVGSGQYWLSTFGNETNVGVATGNLVLWKGGFKIVKWSDDAVPGLVGDYAYGISDQNGASGWRVGFQVGAFEGVWPFRSSSQIMAAVPSNIGGPAMEAATGINLRGITFGRSSFEAAGFRVGPTGNVGALVASGGTLQTRGQVVARTAVVNTITVLEGGLFIGAVTLTGSASPGGGTTATFSVTGYAVPFFAQVAVPGTDYEVGDDIALTDGTFSTACSGTVSQVDGSGGVLGVTITEEGAYSVPPVGASATSTSGAGTGCTLTPYLRVTSASVTNAGTLYDEHLPPTVASAAAVTTIRQALFQITMTPTQVPLELNPGSSTQVDSLRLQSGGPTYSRGTGSPEGAVTAPIGSLYVRTDGGAGTTLYVKESGTGNTGWIAK